MKSFVSFNRGGEVFVVDECLDDDIYSFWGYRSVGFAKIMNDG